MSVAVIFTGGTISGVVNPDTGRVDVQLSGADLMRGMPLPETVAIDWGCVPSSAIRPDDMWSIRRAALAAAQGPGIDGVVISHGTDTMEETALLLDLTWPLDTPVVLTGAMRNASQPGADGPANLQAAVRVAADRAVRGQGALVVMNDEIHAARRVVKAHAGRVHAFISGDAGPIGRVEPDRVELFARVQRPPVPETAGPVGPVDLHLLGAGTDDRLLRASVDTGARGIVLEAFGRGNLPPDAVPGVEYALERSVPVVLCTRTGAGRAWRPHLEEAGCLSGGDLTGPKARIALMLALGGEAPLDAWFS